MRPVITVNINGTSENPYARMGLKQNPFGQINKAEYDAVEMKLNALGGEPIKDEEDIRTRLKGFPADFIDWIVECWLPGAMVTVQVELWET